MPKVYHAFHPRHDRYMNIPETIMRDYLVPHDYVKPTIEVGNYYLEWDKASYGIIPHEIADLRKFISELSPYFTPVFFSAASGIQTLLEAQNRPRDTARIIQGFSPKVTVSYRKEGFSYFLHMGADGASSIERAEMLRSSEGADRQTQLQLCWELGNLLFRRQQTRTIDRRWR